MKSVSDLNKLIFKIHPRSICTGLRSQCEDKRNFSGAIKNYMEEESPLKNFSLDNDWATTPFPEGTPLPEKNKIRRFDLSDSSVIMFPGQGCQYVGMGKSLRKYAVVKEMFECASSILGYDLEKLCLDGPQEVLDQTKYCQPATLVCSLAVIEELKEHFPHALQKCHATFGYSLGEISALVFAGSLSFENAIKLIKTRSEAMQECSKKVDSGMLTVLLGSDSLLKEAIIEAKDNCIAEGITDPVCSIASYLMPECKVLGGHSVALKYIENNLKKFKIRRASRLPVSGAFHTSLMEEAVVPLKEVLEKINIKEPLVKVISNVNAKPYRSTKSIAGQLAKQLYMPVKFEQIFHQVFEKALNDNYPRVYECGPGKTLTTILRGVNNKAAKNATNLCA